VDPNSTAYPDRPGKLPLSPVLTYLLNETLNPIADDISTGIQNTLVQGSDSRLVAYVNYARGDERMEELYGYEPGG
jgi:hypothetical protein